MVSRRDRAAGKRDLDPDGVEIDRAGVEKRDLDGCRNRFQLCEALHGANNALDTDFVADVNDYLPWTLTYGPLIFQMAVVICQSVGRLYWYGFDSYFTNFFWIWTTERPFLSGGTYMSSLNKTEEFIYFLGYCPFVEIAIAITIIVASFMARNPFLEAHPLSKSNQSTQDDLPPQDPTLIHGLTEEDEKAAE